MKGQTFGFEADCLFDIFLVTSTFYLFSPQAYPVSVYTIYVCQFRLMCEIKKLKLTCVLAVLAGNRLARNQSKVMI